MSESRARRGFASMSRDEQRTVASKGGKAVHAQGVAHALTTEDCRKGGVRRGMELARDAARMTELGRKGGLARQAKLATTRVDHE